MLDHCIADLAPLAGEDLEGPCRKPSFVCQLSKIDCGEKRLGSRLQNDSIARGQGRSRFPAGNRKRKIPWHDGSNDAHRLAQCEIESASPDRDGLTEEFADRASVIFKDARAQFD